MGPAFSSPRVILSSLFATAVLGIPKQATANTIAPDAAFIQLGSGSGVRAITTGLMWQTGWAPFGDRSSVYVEASLSRWMTHGAAESDKGTLSQVGLIPVLRYRIGEASSAWFGEIGVGATVTSRLYQTSDRKFGSAFNFGDHLALGKSLCSQLRCELALRIEHFSNGGIKRPNPGENFVQLRFVRRFE
jgi:hypothetical protein